MKRKKVAIVYRTLFQYRKDFYERLRESLLEDNIELTLIYGKLRNKEFKTRNDQIDLDWGIYIENKVVQIGRKELMWQPCLKYLKDKDVVIVEQASKLLINYYLMVARRSLGLKFCYWGHGRNMQLKENSIFNRFKYLFLTKCDWWFAYTRSVKEFLIEKGFPGTKITVVQNAINTQLLREQYNSIEMDEVEKIKSTLGIHSDNVGIFCGAMYVEKKIGFILDACRRIKEAIPDFHMIFIGSGPDLHLVEDAAKTCDWIHSLGSMFGEERVQYFKLAAIQLMPGAVGLGTLDSFAMQTPLITTVQEYHGPEIDYFEHGKNGLITEENLEEYSDTVIEVLASKKYRSLADDCRLCATKYTIENMVDNFKSGILECLADH